MISGDNAGKKQGHRWQKGQSGNPSGKARGTRHRATMLAEKLIAGEAEAVVQAIIEAAKDGDVQAGKAILDRLAPPRRDRPVKFPLPKIETAADALGAMRAILEAVAGGDLTPSEAESLKGLIESYTRTLVATDFEERLTRLEKGP